jgi:polyketide biosynthesis enoyl-CoA hydratase PksI
MSTSVVDLKKIEPTIALVTMQDRESKNGFSEYLIKGLIAAFKQVEEDPEIKVVILTGYDTYFASGGTKESLLTLQRGGAKFTEANIYSLPLVCKVPVIAAMQGHGIGGGFVMGLFADFVIFSREGVYTANFMKYGFTPGMGATYILPRKLGMALGQEMLMVADNYRGEDLRLRGVPFPVVPQPEVLPSAVALAKKLSLKPRISLITLKDHLVAELRAQLPDVVQQELKMHAVTFPLEEVQSNIQRLFGT